MVCNETHLDADSLRVHAQNQHGLVLNLEKLTDHNEPDLFVRFIKSMEVAEDYIEDRKRFYPSHWDQLGERVKIRKLAQIKLAITSKCIEKNMEKNDVRRIKHSGLIYESNTI